MDLTNPTDAQFAAYRAMWDYFNTALFNGELSRVILNFSRRARSLGFFAPARWKTSSGQITHEISLNPTYLTGETAREVASTLVHEMAHLWRYEQGTRQGTPPRGGYHDAQWAAKMEALGLQPSSTGAPGGARVGYKMSHYIVEDGAFARAFQSMPAHYLLPWTCGVDEDAVEGKSKGKSKEKELAKRKVKLKYSCPKCSLNVWGRAGLRLSCEDCNKDLVSGGDDAGDGDEHELRVLKAA